MKVLECPGCHRQGILISAVVEWNMVTDKWEVVETYDEEDQWCPRCSAYIVPEFREV